LLKLFEMLKNNQVTISVSQLAKKMSLNTTDLANVLGGLFDRDIITIRLEEKNGKTKESFNLDNFMGILENYLESDRKLAIVEENETITKQIVSLVEDTMKRPLTPLEIQIVIDWSNNGETLEHIQQALALATSANKLNLKYVDSCLSSIDKTPKEMVLDEEKSKLLEDFYRNIK